LQQRRDARELVAVELPIELHMRFVIPGGPAGCLHHRTHGSAVVGAIEQELLEDVRVARRKTRAQAWHVAALGQAGQHHQIAEIFATELPGRLQATERGLVAKINLAVALIGCNDEAKTVAQVKQQAPLVESHDGAGRVAWRTYKKQLGAAPDRFGDPSPVDAKVAGGLAWGVVELGAGQHRGPFVDLVERVRCHHGGRPAGVNHGLCQCEQGFA
jgi:hypothetical protein